MRWLFKELSTWSTESSVILELKISFSCKRSKIWLEWPYSLHVMLHVFLNAQEVHGTRWSCWPPPLMMTLQSLCLPMSSFYLQWHMMFRGRDPTCDCYPRNIPEWKNNGEGLCSWSAFTIEDRWWSWGGWKLMGIKLVFISDPSHILKLEHNFFIFILNVCCFFASSPLQVCLCPWWLTEIRRALVVSLGMQGIFPGDELINKAVPSRRLPEAITRGSRLAVEVDCSQLLQFVLLPLPGFK